MKEMLMNSTNGAHPTGGPRKDSCVLISVAYLGKKRGIYPPIPIPHWLRVIPGTLTPLHF